MLLAAGAAVDARQAGGFTPLHGAAEHGDPEMVELFLSAGADPTATTDDGKTPPEIAEEAGHPDVAQRLRDVAGSAGAVNG
jgi:ankyrin repeat protein